LATYDEIICKYQRVYLGGDQDPTGALQYCYFVGWTEAGEGDDAFQTVHSSRGSRRKILGLANDGWKSG
jgi:hypothetical protein